MRFFFSLLHFIRFARHTYGAYLPIKTVLGQSPLSVKNNTLMKIRHAAAIVNIYLSKCIFRWLGEKYDGVRACWHPSNRKVYPFILSPYVLYWLYIICVKGRGFTQFVNP